MAKRLLDGWLWILLLLLAAAWPMPVFAEEDEEEGEGEEADAGVEELDFLKEQEPAGNLKVPDAVAPAAKEAYRKALFYFDQIRRNRSCWGRAAEAGEPKHRHEVALDLNGNGTTDNFAGHVHEIKEGMAQDASGHTHDLDGIKGVPLTGGKLRFGSIDGARHFFHVLGVMEPAKDGHRHVVACYYSAPFQSAARGKDHLHIVENFASQEAIRGFNPNRTKIKFTDDHKHDIRWIAPQYFQADSMKFLGNLFEEAGRKHPGFAQAHYYSCICWQTILEFDRALKEVEKSIRALPSFHEAFCERGDINARLGNNSASRADYRKSLGFKTDFAQAVYCDGVGCLREGNWNDAAKVLAQAIEVGRKEAEPKIADLVAKSKVHLAEDKRAAFEDYTNLLLKADMKGLEEAAKNINKEFSGKSRAWIQKAQEICQMLTGAGYWLKEIEKERSFPVWPNKFGTESDNYTVTTCTNQDMADLASAQLENVYKLYRMKFKLQVPTKTKVRFFLYPDHESYVKDGAPPSSGGYASPYFQKIVQPISPQDYQEKGFSLSGEPTPEKLENTFLVLFHEAFHQYLSKFIEEPPQCFNEGCADYFGPSSFKAKKVAGKWTGELVIRVNPWRLNNMKQILNGGWNLPFEPFWKMTKGEMYHGRYAGMFYAQAWAWVFFLFERTDGYKDWEEEPETAKTAKRKYFEILGSYYQALRKGKGLNLAWEDSFGRMKPAQLEALEKEWKDFIMALK